MCNYMAKFLMIWCLNISTVFSCTGTQAIHSQGQARRQQHETHECERALQTRELAVQPRIFMTESLLKANRKERPEKVKNINQERRERGMIGEGQASPVTLKNDNRFLILCSVMFKRIRGWQVTTKRLAGTSCRQLMIILFAISAMNYFHN